MVYSSRDLIPIGDTDFYFQLDRDCRESNSRVMFTLGSVTFILRSVKQTCIANLTMEAKYIAFSLEANAKELRNSQKWKHVEKKFHLGREIVQRWDVSVEKVTSMNNISDHLTKILLACSFLQRLKGMELEICLIYFRVSGGLLWYVLINIWWHLMIFEKLIPYLLHAWLDTLEILKITWLFIFNFNFFVN